MRVSHGSSASLFKKETRKYAHNDKHYSQTKQAGFIHRHIPLVQIYGKVRSKLPVPRNPRVIYLAVRGIFPIAFRQLCGSTRVRGRQLGSATVRLVFTTSGSSWSGLVSERRLTGVLMALATAKHDKPPRKTRRKWRVIWMDVAGSDFSELADTINSLSYDKRPRRRRQDLNVGWVSPIFALPEACLIRATARHCAYIFGIAG